MPLRLETSAYKVSLMFVGEDCVSSAHKRGAQRGALSLLDSNRHCSLLPGTVLAVV